MLNDMRISKLFRRGNKRRVSIHFLIYGGVFITAYIGFVCFLMPEIQQQPVKITLSSSDVNYPDRDSQHRPIVPASVSASSHLVPNSESVMLSGSLTSEDGLSVITGKSGSDAEIALNDTRHLKQLLSKITSNFSDIDSIAIEELWRLAANTQDYKAAMAALHLVVENSSDPLTIQLAKKAVQDLKYLQNNKVNKHDELIGNLYIPDKLQNEMNRATNTDGVFTDGEAVSGSKLNIEVVDKLVYLSQYAETDVDREAALHALEDSRLPQTVNILEQNFTLLEGNARSNAVNTLWHFAADNVEREKAMSLLQTAALDSDPAISAQASQALADLTNPSPPIAEENITQQQGMDSFDLDRQ